MKALTLTQPWASLVALGHKRVETRSWPTHYRGPLAIHSARGFPTWARQFAEEERAVGRLPSRVPCGAILCTVWLADCRPAQDVALEVSALERHLGDFTCGRWAWILEDLHVFSEPIPASGAPSLWEWRQEA